MSLDSSKELKKKVRNIGRTSSRNDHRHDLHISQIQGEFESLDKRVSALEEKTNSSNPEHPPELPEVSDLVSLRNFVLAHFGADWCSEYVSELKIKCGPVRDALASTFDHIQRINDQPQHPSYPNVDKNKHRDAIYFYESEIGEWVIIDFCKGSSDPGHLWDPQNKTGSLSWSHVDETPW